MRTESVSTKQVISANYKYKLCRSASGCQWKHSELKEFIKTATKIDRFLKPSPYVKTTFHIQLPLAIVPSPNTPFRIKVRPICRYFGTVVLDWDYRLPSPSHLFYVPFSGTTWVSQCQRKKKSSSEFYGARVDNIGIHTDHPAGRHSIRTNQRPTSFIPHFYAGSPSCRKPPTLSLIGTGTKYAGLHTQWRG